MSDLIRMNGWIRKLTGSGIVYYVKRKTGETRYFFIPFLLFSISVSFRLSLSIPLSLSISLSVLELFIMWNKNRRNQVIFRHSKFVHFFYFSFALHLFVYHSLFTYFFHFLYLSSPTFVYPSFALYRLLNRLLC